MVSKKNSQVSGADETAEVRFESVFVRYKT